MKRRWTRRGFLQTSLKGSMGVGGALAGMALPRQGARGRSLPKSPDLAAPAVPWGSDHHRVFRKRFPHLLSIWVQGEDLPVETNRVELDPEVKDSHGIPAPRVTYTHSENTLRMMAHGAARARQVLEATGAVEILDGGLRQPGWHLLGTARMGTSPRNSVVNAWHQAHDVRNLFMVGTAVPSPPVRL